MRKAYFSSLVFAVLTSISLAVSAAPSAKPETPTPIAAQMTKAEQTTAKVNLNTADAESL
jgi:competence protein ComEA